MIICDHYIYIYISRCSRIWYHPRHQLTHLSWGMRSGRRDISRGLSQIWSNPHVKWEIYQILITFQNLINLPNKLSRYVNFVIRFPTYPTKSQLFHVFKYFPKMPIWSNLSTLSNKKIPRSGRHKPSRHSHVKPWTS